MIGSDSKPIKKREENLENKENSMVVKTGNLIPREIKEKNVLQEKSLNECSTNKSNQKKQEIFATVKFDFSPKKVSLSSSIQILKYYLIRKMTSNYKRVTKFKF